MSSYRQHRPARPSTLGAAPPTLPPMKATTHTYSSSTSNSYSVRDHHHQQHQHRQQQHPHQQTRSLLAPSASASASSPSHAHAHTNTSATTRPRAKPRVTFASSPSPEDYHHHQRSSSPLPYTSSYARGYPYGYSDAADRGREGYNAQIRSSPEIGADIARRGVGEQWEDSGWTHGYRAHHYSQYDHYYQKETDKVRYAPYSTTKTPSSYASAPRSYSTHIYPSSTTTTGKSARYRPQAHLAERDTDVDVEYPPSSDFDLQEWDSEPASEGISEGMEMEMTPPGPRRSSGSGSDLSDEGGEVDVDGRGKGDDDGLNGKINGLDDGDDDRDDDEGANGGEEDGEYIGFGAFGYESTRTTFFRVSAVRGQWRSDPCPPVLKGLERKAKAASVPVESGLRLNVGKEIGAKVKVSARDGEVVRTISEPAPAKSVSISASTPTSGTSTLTTVGLADRVISDTSTTATAMAVERCIDGSISSSTEIASTMTMASTPAAAATIEEGRLSIDATPQFSTAGEDGSANTNIATDNNTHADIDADVNIEQEIEDADPDHDPDALLSFHSPLNSSDTLPSLTSDDNERDSSSDPLDSDLHYHYGDMPSSPLPPSSPPLLPTSPMSVSMGMYMGDVDEKERERSVSPVMLDSEMDMELERENLVDGNTRGSSPLSDVPDEDEDESQEMKAAPVVKERSVSVAVACEAPMEAGRDVVMEASVVPRRVEGDKRCEKVKVKPRANDNGKGKAKVASVPLKDNNGAVREETANREHGPVKTETGKKVQGKKRRVEDDWDWEEEENENEAEEKRIAKVAAPVRKRKKQVVAEVGDRDRESSSAPSVAAASSSSSSSPPVGGHNTTKKSTKSRRANTKSKTKWRSASPSDNAQDLSPSDDAIRPTDPETKALHAQVCGMLIQAMSTSRASSLPLSTLSNLVLQSQPSLASSRSHSEWVKIMDCVLHAGEASRGGSGVFGKVESSGAVDEGEERRRLEGRWFYVPELDEDQERAGVVRAMMPRPAKRSETKKYKQYYWRPLKKISMWDPEDAL